MIVIPTPTLSASTRCTASPTIWALMGFIKSSRMPIEDAIPALEPFFAQVRKNFFVVHKQNVFAVTHRYRAGPNFCRECQVRVNRKIDINSCPPARLTVDILIAP